MPDDRCLACHGLANLNRWQTLRDSTVELMVTIVIRIVGQVRLRVYTNEREILFDNNTSKSGRAFCVVMYVLMTFMNCKLYSQGTVIIMMLVTIQTCDNK